MFFFFIYCSLLGDFSTENITKKKKNGLVLKMSQMKLLLKNPGGTRQIYRSNLFHGFTHTLIVNRLGKGSGLNLA